MIQGAVVQGSVVQPPQMVPNQYVVQQPQVVNPASVQIHGVAGVQSVAPPLGPRQPFQSGTFDCFDDFLGCCCVFWALRGGPLEVLVLVLLRLAVGAGQHLRGHELRGDAASAAVREFSALNERTRETIAAILDGDRDCATALRRATEAYAAESTRIRSKQRLAPPPTLCRRCRAYHASEAGLCSSCAAVRRTSMPSARGVGLRPGVHAVRARD